MKNKTKWSESPIHGEIRKWEEDQAANSRCSSSTGSLRPKLTQAQIENWRRILTLQIGPYAQIMPEDDIQAHANAMQSMIDAENIEDYHGMKSRWQ